MGLNVAPSKLAVLGILQVAYDKYTVKSIAHGFKIFYIESVDNSRVFV